jgi:endonuclease YncB( thermonuclease family)
MRRWLVFLVLLAAGGVLAQATPVGVLYGPVPVASVVDGDTFVVASNVGPRTVRLIGVDAPETQHPTFGREPFGPEAAAWLRERLPAGTLVWLELDFGPEDAFGRLLAYVYVEDAAGAWTLDGLAASQVNLELVVAGLARPVEIAPNVTYADRYAEAAAVARSAGRGLWAAPRDVAATPGPPAGSIVIACVLYDPDTPNDTDGESVTLLLRERLDTRGYYVWDEGSGTAFRLPVGDQGPGELTVYNPGQGAWNNGGDTVYLMLGETVVDAWDYTDARPGRAGTVCR